MSADMERRWREAKLGERSGSRVLVSIECEGDPRAEVLGAIAASDGAPSIDPLVRELQGEPPGRTHAGDLAAMTGAAEAGFVHVAPNPPRRSRKGGAK